MSTFDKWARRARELKRETYALYLACQDRRTPWYAKLTMVAVVAYTFSPIDLIPDFIPVLGYLDDLVLIPLGVLMVRRMIPALVMEDCRRRAEEVMERGRPICWIAAGVIVAIWLFLGWLCFFLVRHCTR